MHSRKNAIKMAPNAPECSDPAHQHLLQSQVDDRVLIQALERRVQEFEERDRSERDRKVRKRLEDFLKRAPDMQRKGVTKAKVSQAFGALADVVKEVREWLREL